MSMDIPAAPAAGAKAAAAPRHAHGKGEKHEADAFTSLLSGKARHPAATAADGEAPAKPAAQGPAKWQAREHAQWRVFDGVKHGRPGEAAERRTAKEEGAVVEAGEQVPQLAIPLGHPVKAPPAPAEGGHAKAGAAAARDAVRDAAAREIVAGRGGAEAAAADATPQPERKRPAAEGSPAREAERPAAAGAQAHGPQRHAAAPAADGVRPAPAGPLQSGRADAAEAPAPKPAEVATAAPEAAREQGARAPEHEPAGERASPKVAVMSVQTAPAPAAPAVPGLSPTSASFVQSLGSAEGLPRYASETAMQGAQTASRPVTTLRIQLHPLDLGTVTAQLSGDGEKLSIEVHVENGEAHHRLQSDGDAIVKALRGMGFDIDRITVQQTPQTAASPGGATNRENAFAAPDQRAGEGRGQPGRQDSGRGHEHRANQGGGGDRGEARGGGVYI